MTGILMEPAGLEKTFKITKKQQRKRWGLSPWPFSLFFLLFPLLQHCPSGDSTNPTPQLGL